MDILGAGVLSVLIASLMYALTNLQFHDFLTSIKSEHVWPFLAIALVSLPLFIAIEKNVKDPILNLGSVSLLRDNYNKKQPYLSNFNF